MMRIVCFGSGAFGLPTFKSLAQRHEIALVVSQPDRPAGRARAAAPTPVADWAAQIGLPVVKPESVNDVDALRAIREARADAWVVIAFGQKLGSALLRDRFAVNLHASLLPRWRGAAPIQRAILAGDRETGVSVIAVSGRMDAGAVLARSVRSIEPSATAGDLHDLLAEDGAPLVARVLNEFAQDALRPQEQDESRVTLAPKISRAETWIDFTQPAEECRRRVHAFSPAPGVHVRIADKGGKPVDVKLLRVQLAGVDGQQAGGGGPPGVLFDAAAGAIACGQGALQLVEVQPAGGLPMTWTDFARGRRLRDGATARPLVQPPAPLAAREQRNTPC